MVRGKSPPLRLGRQVLQFLPQSHKGYLFIDGIFEQRGMENRSSNGIPLQKRLLFATKLFRRLQKAVRKTSFFDGKSLSSTITRQILKHL